MWPCCSSKDIVGGVHVGHPVTQSFVNRILQGARPRGYGDHFRTEQSHPSDVQSLTLGVFFTHVDDTVQIEQCRRGSGCHAVLPSTSFSNDSFLTHPLGEKSLTEHIVDFVGASVVEILTFEEHPHTPQRAARTGEPQ